MKKKSGCIFKVVIIILILSVGILLFYINYDRYEPLKNQSPIAIMGGRIFDGTDQPVKNDVLIVDQGKIVCLGADCKVPDDAMVIDAEDKAILPGLIDMHIHLSAPSQENSNYSFPRMILDMIRYRPKVRKNLHKYGVTTIRSVGDTRKEPLKLRQLLIDGELEGPRLFLVGPGFTAPGGHPAGTVFKGNDWLIENATVQVDNVDLAREEVRILAELGVDGIKLIYDDYDNGTNENPIPRLKKEVMHAIINEALEQNIWVAAHTGSLQELKDAVEAGANTIEHGIKDLQQIDSLALQLLLDKKITYVPTLRVAKNYIGESKPDLMEMHKINTKLVSDKGIPVATGSDTQGKEMQFGKTLHDELKLLVESGLTPVEALNAGTIASARALRKENELGKVALNYLADLIIVNGRPWDEIDDIDNVEMVIQNGKIVYNK